jgi:hypothetical protein
VDTRTRAAGWRSFLKATNELRRRAILDPASGNAGIQLAGIRVHLCPSVVELEIA